MAPLWMWLGAWAWQSGRQPRPLLSGAREGPLASLADVVQEKVGGTLQQRREQLLLRRGEAAQHVRLHCVGMRRAPYAHPQPRHCLLGSRQFQGALVRSAGALCHPFSPDPKQDRGADSHWS